MSLNSQTLTGSGQDWTRNGSSSSSRRGPMENERMILKPSTPTSNPIPPENAITIAVSSQVLFNMEKEQQIPEKMNEVSETQLRVAFDGDGVLFSDESERIFKKDGLEGFQEHEKTHEKDPGDGSR